MGLEGMNDEVKIRVLAAAVGFPNGAEKKGS